MPRTSRPDLPPTSQAMTQNRLPSGSASKTNDMDVIPMDELWTPEVLEAGPRPLHLGAATSASLPVPRGPRRADDWQPHRAASGASDQPSPSRAIGSMSACSS